jgi:hypothetical protein
MGKPSSTLRAGRWMSHSEMKKAKAAAEIHAMITGLFSAFSNLLARLLRSSSKSPVRRRGGGSA